MANVNNSATMMYALSMDQVINGILHTGREKDGGISTIVQGDIGTGKSSILDVLSKMLPTHTACYFDCTTKDLGDITIPKLKMLDDGGDGVDYVEFATNAELGVHLDQPILLMIDEYGKANPMVQNALLRLLQERKVGSRTLHPDSIIFATTNLGAEGVGDLMKPHARNRVTVVTMRKPTHMEWIEWGVNNGIDPIIMTWVKDNPQVFQSFTMVKDPDENPYIYHPKSLRTAFVTPRSLHKASAWTSKRNVLDDQTVTAGLMGTIGERGAMDLMATVKVADQLPKLEDIKNNPHTATVPTSAAAVCMVVYRTLSLIEKDWMDAWMDYMARLDKEAQGLFANGVRSRKYSRQGIVMTNKKFSQWALANNYLFAADKK